MEYNYIEDFEKITDLRDTGVTAVYSSSMSTGIRIKISPDGEKVFYQEIISGNLGEIKETELVYYGPEEEVLDILNLEPYEFERDYDNVTAGIFIDQIYLIEEFYRENM